MTGRTSAVPMTKTPPGPPGVPFLGNLPAPPNQRLEAFQQLRRQYGDVVRLKIGPRFIYLVSHPDDVQHILQDNNRNYTKGRALEKAKVLLGEGLLTSEGAYWRRQRRLAQPAFHRKRIDGLAGTMTDVTREMLERWLPISQAGGELNLSAEMMRLTLEVVSRTMFGTGLSPEEAQAVGEALPFILRETNRRLTSLLGIRERLPLPSRFHFQEELDKLNRIVMRIIEQRRHSEQRDDLLGMLMSARDEETGEAMDDHQLRDEVMTIFLAGHETTANNLSWTIYLLSLHPEERRKVEEEVDRVLSGRTPSIEDVPHLVFTRQVIDESLRLYPPAWAIGRQTIDEDIIGGYPIPAKSGIIISTYIVHRHPDFWENPEGFDPQRFTPERARERPRYAFLPFGGGPRQCIGNNFALLESTLVLAMITQRFRLNLVSGHPVEMEPLITLRPRYGILVTIHPR